MNKFIKRATTILVLILSFMAYSQNLKVMTYNIRLDVAVDGENDWSHRKEFFTSQIQFYEPDVFGIQEATPNQVIDISNALSQYNHIGIGREGVGKGESSNIFYKKERFSISNETTFWLSETPNEISKGWDAACNRVCTFALFEDLKSKKSFWVFNTHLDHIGEVARTKGIELILSKIEAVNIQKLPVIFMGDFNSEPNENRIFALKKIMNDSRELSVEKPFGPFGTFNNFQYNEPATKQIDYIFLSKNSFFNVNKYAVLTDSKNLRFPSDHFPVYIEIKYN
jgi:endonuclease/exonuclease/phosphatase family metal-dependent hydrolase